MGKPSASASEKAGTVLQGSLSANDASSSAEFYRRFNLWCWGDYSGEALIERSPDGGTTWFVSPVEGDLGNNVAFPYVSRVIDEPEPGVLYRIRTFNRVSGTLNYRLSQ